MRQSAIPVTKIFHQVLQDSTVHHGTAIFTYGSMLQNTLLLTYTVKGYLIPERQTTHA